MKSGHQSVGAIFAIPFLIALVSGIGLVSAMTGDGWRDALSWAGLMVPVVAVGWAVRARRS